MILMSSWVYRIIIGVTTFLSGLCGLLQYVCVCVLCPTLPETLLSFSVSLSLSLSLPRARSLSHYLFLNFRPRPPLPLLLYQVPHGCIGRGIWVCSDQLRHGCNNRSSFCPGLLIESEKYTDRWKLAVRRGRGQEGGEADQDARVPSTKPSLVKKTPSCQSTGPKKLSLSCSLSRSLAVSHGAHRDRSKVKESARGNPRHPCRSCRNSVGMRFIDSINRMPPNTKRLSPYYQ